MSTRDRRLLAVSDGVARKKTRRAIAAQIRHDHAVARRRQQRRDIDKAVDVVWPAVQQDDRRAVGRTRFGIADIQHAGVDLLQRAERGVGPGLIRASACARARCRSSRTELVAAAIAAAPKNRRRSLIDIIRGIGCTFGQSSSSLHGRSAERERKGLHARVEKLDLELAIGDGLRLADQLVQPLLGHCAVALVRRRRCREPRLAAVRRSAREISRKFPALPAP